MHCRPVRVRSNFALSYSALTGESFCKSGKTFLSHCSRHGFVKVYVVDALAGMIFRFGAFVFALLTMGVMLLVAKARVRNNEPDMTDKELMDTLIVVGVISFVLAGIIFHFVMSLLLMIVDAAYACVVLDLDNYGRTNQFHRPAIANVIMQKVKPDFVVVAQPSQIYVETGNPSAQVPQECGARCRGAPRRSSEESTSLPPIAGQTLVILLHRMGRRGARGCPRLIRSEQAGLTHELTIDDECGVFFEAGYIV